MRRLDLLLPQGMEQTAREASYNVSTFASRCGVSRRTVGTFIRRRFGIAPHDWMLQLRMTEASRLLREGMYVKEVSASLAFKQASAFCRAFKHFHGLTPHEYLMVQNVRLAAKAI